MPTDLPENFSGTAPKGDSKFPVKALVHVIGDHLVFPLALEYGICYLLTGVISNTLLHSGLNRPGMALGVLAAGLLVRNFTRQKAQQPQPQLVSLPVMMPADLASFRREIFDEPGSVPGGEATPYL